MNITEEMLIEAMKYIEFNSTAATILNQRRNAKKPAAGPTADPRSETGLTADSPMAGSSIAMVADEEDTININWGDGTKFIPDSQSMDKWTDQITKLFLFGDLK